MATKEYKQIPGLRDLIISPYGLGDVEAAKASADNALDMLNSTLASVAQMLVTATMNEEFPPDMNDVRNVAWLMKELLDVQADVMCIESNATYAMARRDDDEARRMIVNGPRVQA